MVVVSLWAAIPCHGFGARGRVASDGHDYRGLRPSASMRRTPPRMAMEPDEVILPLFAPAAGTETPFPFPAAELLGERAYRYTLDTPSSIRMLRSAEGGGSTLFGHCICSADGRAPEAAGVGSVGVTVRLLGAGSEAFGGEVVTVEAVAVYRFVVREIVSSFPFATARVAPLSDAATTGENAEALEAEVEAALGSLVRLAAPLLSSAALSDEAAAALEAPAALLRRHARRQADVQYTGAANGEYAGAAGRPQTAEAAAVERRQSLSLAACELVQLPPQAAAAALAATCSSVRLRLLLAHLRPVAAEMAALQALGALGDAGEGLVSGVPGQPWKLRVAQAEASSSAAGASSSAAGRRRVVAGFQAVDIPLGGGAAGGAPRPAAAAELPPGARIEFWWNEEWDWCAATVRKRLQTGGRLLHTLEFDGWGEEWYDESLEFDDGGRRWRPLGPRRDEV